MPEIARVHPDGPRVREVRSELRRRGIKRGGQGYAVAGSREQRLARALGWFSVGLGAAELAAPRGVAFAIGVNRRHRLLLRLSGLREIATGVAILSRSRPTRWVRARILGDMLDLGMLGLAWRSRRARRGRLAVSGAAVLGVTAIDIACASMLSREGAAQPGAARVLKSIAINRPADELYGFWHDFENLPRVMSHLRTVRKLDERRSHWMTEAPAGTSVEWDAEIVDDRPNRRIAWRSLPSSDVPNEGAVDFEPLPAGRGTLVRVTLEYRPPGGQIGAAFAELFGDDPAQQIGADLRRFKQLLETGEIATGEGPHGRRSSLARVALRKEARS
jgi:uncharacterized membrane protein